MIGGGLAAEPPPPTLYRIPDSIVSNGSVDVTDDINAWLRSIPNGTAASYSLALFKAGATYRVDESVGTSLMRSFAGPNQETAGLNRSYLILDGNGCTIDWSRNTPTAMANRAGVGLVGADHCDIRNFIVQGPWALDYSNGYSASYEWQHGIACFNGDDCYIHDNTLRNSLGDGVSLAGSDRIVIEENVIEGTGRMGVAVVSDDDVTIRRNTFDRISYHVVDLEPENEAHPVTNILIENNTIRRHRHCFIGAESGVCSPRSNYVIRNNTMANSGQTAFPPIAVASTLYSTTLPEGGCVNNLATGLQVTGNVLRSTQNNYQAVRVRGYVGAVINDNTIVQDSPFSDRSMVLFEACAGDLQVKRNICSGTPNAYIIDSVVHGPGVASCGNTTSAGANVPSACA